MSEKKPPLKAKGVGFFKGEIPVLGAVREAFLELLLAIKGRV